ncbi:MAG: 2-hydroxyacyl-CoA dehydratase family protein [Chloroflexi bacterium]|nr:2-hydroxyacyl-CoA dehydratase family protein [Chloroflexota bacterium]
MTPDKKAGQESIVGRGSREGARLFREWFQRLSGAAERGEPTAYVFVMGSIAEVLNAFGFNLVFPEISSLQTAVRRVAHEYLTVAEDYGYSPDVCGYVKADVGVQLRNGEHPMGRIPKPTLSILTNACNTYVKWGEIWERWYGNATFALDSPGARSANLHTQPGDQDFENDRKYVEFQLRELITLCEQLTGTQFDIDKLRETMQYTNDMSAAWKRVLELNRSAPAPFNALNEGTVYLGVANALRGKKEGSEFFRDLVEEMEFKSRNRIGTLTEEKYRLTFVGVPCYPIFRRFYDLFAEWGGTFVNSTYLKFASGGLNLGYQYDLNRPLESLAEGTLLSLRHAMDSMFFQNQDLVDEVDEFHVDGIVYHPIKSCRTVSTGLADNRRAVMAARDIATLFIESDMMDKRVVSEAQMKNRIDAFFEGLATRKLHAAAAA